MPELIDDDGNFVPPHFEPFNPHVFMDWGMTGTADTARTAQEAVRNFDTTFAYKLPKKKSIPVHEREYEIRVEKDKDGRRTFVSCVITNEGDRILDEWVAVTKDEILDGVSRMHEMVATNNSRATNLRLRQARARGHLNRDERQFMRSTKEDIEKEDQFELDINAEEIDRAEKELQEKEARELDEALKAYVPF